MKRLTLVLVCVLAAGLFFAQRSEGDAQAVNRNEMLQKLEYSTNILKGLVTEDFETIIKSGKALNDLAQRKWLENESTEYRTQNQAFWFASGTLVMAAEAKNIDGATLSYTQMTLSCIQCHKLLRSD